MPPVSTEVDIEFALQNAVLYYDLQRYIATYLLSFMIA